MNNWPINENFNFLDNLFSISLDKVSHFNKNFFFDFSNQLSFNIDWNFNDFRVFFDIDLNNLFLNFRNWFNDFSGFHDDLGNFSNKFFNFMSTNLIRNFLFDFNINRFRVAILLQNRNFNCSLTLFVEIDWFICEFLNFFNCFPPELNRHLFLNDLLFFDNLLYFRLNDFLNLFFTRNWFFSRNFNDFFLNHNSFYQLLNYCWDANWNFIYSFNLYELFHSINDRLLHFERHRLFNNNWFFIHLLTIYSFFCSNGNSML